MKKITFIFFFFSWFAFSQEKTEKEDVLIKKWEKICKESNTPLFCKTLTFYNNEQIDSCYINTTKALLNKKLTTKERDFFTYLLAYTSYKKGLYKKTLESVSNLSEDRDYKAKKIFLKGNAFYNLENFDEAISNYEEYFIITKSKDVYHNLGICYLHKKEYTKAEKYFNQYINQISKKDTSLIINAKTSLANVYYNKYLDDKAIPLFKEAYDLAQSYSNLNLKRNASKNMAVVEKNRKRYKESIAYYAEFTRWKDSIWDRDKIWELTEKDKQIAVAQKQQEIAVQEEQIKRQKTIQKGLLVGATGLLIFIGGLAYFYQKLKKQKQLITQQKEELDVANKTKNYLFSVVSHDLRSPINTIKRQHKKLAKHIANNDLPAIKEANQQAISVTDSTSHLLNNVLQWSLGQSNQLNFSQEDYALQPIIEHILFDYEELAESNEISITTNFTENITVKTDKESLKIVLRNLIDNSVKYMNGAGNIAIATSIENNQARIEIKDSGIGISAEKLQKINALKDLSVDKIDRSKGVGLGLILCQTLIKKNNGTLFFESEEGKSTTAIVLLPLA